jgi:hypothetical protein
MTETVMTDYQVEVSSKIVEVTTQELVNVLMSIGVTKKLTSDFVNVVMGTEPTMNKTDNPFYGKVIKTSSRNYKLLSDYEKRVDNNSKKEGIEGNFVSSKPSGRHHISPLVTIDDKTESVHYLNLEYFVNVKPVVSYEFNGLPMVQEDMELMKQFFRTKYPNNKQPQEKKVEVITPKISNIISMSMGGVKYVVKN